MRRASGGHSHRIFCGRMRRASGGRSRPKHIPRKQGPAASPALCFCRRTAPKPPTPRRAVPPLGRSPDAHPTPARRRRRSTARSSTQQTAILPPLSPAGRPRHPAAAPAPHSPSACQPVPRPIPPTQPPPAPPGRHSARRSRHRPIRPALRSCPPPPRLPRPPIGRKGVGSSPDIPTFLDFRRIMLSLWPENERAEREPGFSDRATDAGGPKR